MLRSLRAAGSNDQGQVSSRLLAAVLAGLWLTSSTASGQPLAPERTAGTLRAAVAAGPDVRGDTARRDLAASLRSTRPKVTGVLPAPLWSRLAFAYKVAHESIQSKPTCATLFTERGAVGLEVLLKVSFAPAAPDKDQTACAGPAVARTEVGGRQIRLCPRFEALSVPAAALILIHEALHSAGMSEKPADPHGLTSVEINQLVAVNCGR